MEEVVATAPTKLAPFRKKSRRAELVVSVFMVMDDHAEAEPRRKKDKHNFIVVSNNTIN
jgi:hypothetical protein